MALLAEDNFLNKVLLTLAEKQASDVHLKSGYKIYYRFLGEIKIYEESPVLTNEIILSYLKTVINEKVSNEFKINKQSDFGFNTSDSTRYRANLYKTNSGYSLALRRINNKASTFEDLNAPSIFKQIAKLEKGLIIISGPTGSGKSTTLNSMINYINLNYEKHIITIEDPIEFVHTNQKSLINQREIGTDAVSFALALKSALREDPDIILIGEMRDAETIKEALRAAETGHLVFATMHTQTAAKSIDRIVDSCESGEKEMVRTMVSSSIQAIILQKLVKHINGETRIAAYEILLGTSAVRNLIRENKINQIDSMIQTGKKFGMIDMETYLKLLFEKGMITREELDENTVKLGKENEEG